MKYNRTSSEGTAKADGLAALALLSIFDEEYRRIKLNFSAIIGFNLYKI
jgi:hypothetical protein